MITVVAVVLAVCALAWVCIAVGYEDGLRRGYNRGWGEGWRARDAEARKETHAGDFQTIDGGVQ